MSYDLEIKIRFVQPVVQCFYYMQADVSDLRGLLYLDVFLESSFTVLSPVLFAAPSRRGDLEILGYCMIQWLSGCLPWEDNLKDPNYVRQSKIRQGTTYIVLG